MVELMRFLTQSWFFITEFHLFFVVMLQKKVRIIEEINFKEPFLPIFG
jgi:hypothetical protein